MARKTEKGGNSVEGERITIRLPIELKECLQQEANRKGITLHDLIVFNLWEGLQRTAPK